jgi:hypothetical protein
MVVVRVNCAVHPKVLAQLRASIRAQAENGPLVLPPFCEVLAEVGADETLVLTSADNQPLFCSGCKYINTYQKAAEWTCPPSRMICPYHFPRGSWIYCPNWNPYGEEALANG